MVDFSFVTIRDFTPNSGLWTPIGAIRSVSRAGATFLLSHEEGDCSLQVSFLSATCFRVRFNPLPGADYTREPSIAVVSRPANPPALDIVADNPEHLIID